MIIEGTILPCYCGAKSAPRGCGLRMYICKETNKPKGITDVKRLILDRQGSPHSAGQLGPTVCVSLDKTIFCKINASSAEKIAKNWLVNAIEVDCCLEDDREKQVIIPRPGATELLVELARYSNPMIYSSLPIEVIEETMLQLSIAEANPEEGGDIEYERSEAYIGHYVWSSEQCIKDSSGYRKSLGVLSEFSDNAINNIWIIDHKPERVDLPTRVIAVSEFKGDPEDRDLFRLIDDVFIN